jgi:alkylation response protein AidB-like acyl-CoA dehydrogenase
MVDDRLLRGGLAVPEPTTVLLDAPSELVDLAAVVRRLCEQELAPLVDAAERDQVFPRQVIERLGELGFLTSEHPDDPERPYRLAESIVIEELARVCSGFATSVIVQISVVPGLLRDFGGDEHRGRWLEAMGRGEAIGSLAVTEPDAGSDVKAMRARARNVPGGYAISGEKVYITNGSLADFFIVAAVVDPDAGREGIGLFIVERDNPGVASVVKMDKTSVRSSDTTIVTFDEAVVEESALLGGDLNGFKKLMSTFDAERVIHASRALGVARAAFDASRRYARQRRQFGKPIADFQAIAFKLADMEVDLEASTLLVRRAAGLADAGRPFHREASIAKLYATEAARRAATEAMQIHGSYGLTAEFPTGRLVADAHLETIGTGTSEIQRSILAREIARRPL